MTHYVCIHELVALFILQLSCCLKTNCLEVLAISVCFLWFPFLYFFNLKEWDIKCSKFNHSDLLWISWPLSLVQNLAKKNWFMTWHTKVSTVANTLCHTYYLLCCYLLVLKVDLQQGSQTQSDSRAAWDSKKGLVGHIKKKWKKLPSNF